VRAGVSVVSILLRRVETGETTMTITFSCPRCNGTAYYFHDEYEREVVTCKRCGAVLTWDELFGLLSETNKIIVSRSAAKKYIPKDTDVNNGDL
jgi:uncharacterized Zn finger protein